MACHRNCQLLITNHVLIRSLCDKISVFGSSAPTYYRNRLCFVRNFARIKLDSTKQSTHLAKVLCFGFKVNFNENVLDLFVLQKENDTNYERCNSNSRKDSWHFHSERGNSDYNSIKNFYKKKQIKIQIDWTIIANKRWASRCSFITAGYTTKTRCKLATQWHK